MKQPPAIPYNLRCHGRVVGKRYLRPRQVPLDHSHSELLPVNCCSKKHQPRRRSCQRKNPCDPPLPEGGKDKEAPLAEGGKDETKYRKARRRHFFETIFPYPLTAMQHYNNGLKEEEQYKATDTRDNLCHFFKKLGFIRLLHFVAEPKYPKSMPNTSDDTTKHFYARIHQKPNRDTHVDYCKLYEEPPKKGTFITEVIRLCCETCGLKDLKALESKSLELSAKGEEGAGGKEDYWDGYYPSGPPEVQ
ncbi:hypothetical protein PIB30_043779 [Stylosanthes scabra]|uniref:Uncharacterized protein n=1 Tax=Stylosanthes scabra TaxID=79078 RepID=A0ABU6QGE0_9FABA|nr:hypothetical protein [Stylosanthes scabra]